MKISTKSIATAALIVFTSATMKLNAQWSLTGNSIGSTNFIGSTNSQSLKFMTKNTQWMVLDTLGRVGIGTGLPKGNLHVVKGLSGTTPYSPSGIVLENNAATYMNILTPDANENGILFGIKSNNINSGIVFNNSGTRKGLQFRTDGNNTRMVIDSSGRVGIGTITPTAFLDVWNSVKISGSSVVHPELRFNRPPGGHQLSTIDMAWRLGGNTFGYMGLYDYTTASTLAYFTQTGNVGIGKYPIYKLDVCGTIRADEIRVEASWCDYVFEDDYQLRPLEEVSEFISANKHLPDVTPGPEIEGNGLEIGKVSSQMIRKIEELTLYVIQLDRQNKEMKKEIDALKK